MKLYTDLSLEQLAQRAFKLGEVNLSEDSEYKVLTGNPDSTATAKYTHSFEEEEIKNTIKEVVEKGGLGFSCDVVIALSNQTNTLIRKTRKYTIENVTHKKTVFGF